MSTSTSSNHCQNACIPCRKVKMRCLPGTGSKACARCQRKDFDCFYERHRRGRKPGMKIGSRNKLTAQRGLESRDEDVKDENGERSSMKSDALSPFQLLSKQAMSGSFSMQNCLAEPSTASRDVEKGSTESGIQKNAYDPIFLNLINLPTARHLFDSFMKYLAPYIVHFDPSLHTFTCVQERSPFLLTVILAAAARTFHPALYPSLHKHGEELLAKTFISGEKSIEIIQAILVKTYWKEPDDTRVWQFVGYAGRMCVDLKGQKNRMAQKSPNSQDSGTDVEVEARESRNLERTWLTLFVYDRSLSLQVGKPWMLHIDDTVRSAPTWYQQCTPFLHGDVILSAFVELRMIGSDILEVMCEDLPSRSHQQHDVLLSLFNADLDKWEKKWHKIFEEVQNLDPCHIFMHRFYGSHFRLFINSFRLQLALTSSSTIPKSALWLCYTSALSMLTLITDILGPSQLLYFAQDSIHIMTAYASIFLIKILLSLPSSLPEDSEGVVLGVLERASGVFAGQALEGTGTASAFQARFLRNLGREYRRTKEGGTAAAGQSRPQSRMLNREIEGGRESDDCDGNGQYRPPQTQPPPAAPIEVDSGPKFHPQSQIPMPTTTTTTNTSTSPPYLIPFMQPQPIPSPPTLSNSIPSPFYGGYDLVPFGENGAYWEDLFGNAGFSIDDGMFLPGCLGFNHQEDGDGGTLGG